MPKTYAAKLQSYLPTEYLELIREAGNIANELGYALFLVGGVVRDLLLNRASFDLDLVVEGDAIRLAKKLAFEKQARLITHHNFGTATLKFGNLTLDLATTRRETYKQPGSLPAVQPGGTIADDLHRRDFTINAMALHLNPAQFGELEDPFNGYDDANNKLVRTLHPRSFIDDATRIFRAIRYEQRLGFLLEKETLKLLTHDLSLINTISGDRIRHELELILKEELPEKAIARADELGLLALLNPALKGNGWLAGKYALSRQLYAGRAPVQLYLSLLIYNLNQTELEEFITKYNFPKTATVTMNQSLELKSRLHSLSTDGIKPADIYQLLHVYNTQAIQANMLAAESSTIKKNLSLYLSLLHNVKSLLNGDDLKKLGIPEGHRLGEILTRLHHTKLNGTVSTRKDEENLVRTWLNLQ